MTEDHYFEITNVAKSPTMRAARLAGPHHIRKGVLIGGLRIPPSAQPWARTIRMSVAEVRRHKTIICGYLDTNHILIRLDGTVMGGSNELLRSLNGGGEEPKQLEEKPGVPEDRDLCPLCEAECDGARGHGEGSPETSCAHADSEPPGTKPTPPRHGTSMEGSRSHPFR